MRLFGATQAEITAAINDAQINVQIDPAALAVAFLEALHAKPVLISSFEMRPARSGAIVDDAMTGGEPLEPRPHALWANGDAIVEVGDEEGNVVEYRVAGGSSLDVSPYSLRSVQGGPVVALYP